MTAAGADRVRKGPDASFGRAPLTRVPLGPPSTRTELTTRAMEVLLGLVVSPLQAPARAARAARAANRRTARMCSLRDVTTSCTTGRGAAAPTLRIRGAGVVPKVTAIAAKWDRATRGEAGCDPYCFLRPRSSI